MRASGGEHVVVLCTAPENVAGVLARALVEARVCACVNVVPRVQSTYRWNGAVQVDDEALLIIKTRRDVVDALERTLRANHPYEVPEILALDVASGAATYLDWLTRETQPV